MPPADSLATFAAAAFLLIVVPGPSVLFIVSRGVVLGRRAALETVVGNTLGVYVLVVAVAAGVGPLVESSAVVFTAVKAFGAAYLVYLGVQAVRHRRALWDALAGGAGRPSRGRVVREGFLVGVGNPKAIVFLAAVLPQFADPARGGVPAQILLLGAVFVAIGAVCDAAWGLLAGTARDWLGRSPRRLAALGATGGAVMVGLGVALALTGRAPER